MEGLDVQMDPAVTVRGGWQRKAGTNHIAETGECF